MEETKEEIELTTVPASWFYDLLAFKLKDPDLYKHQPEAIRKGFETLFKNYDHKKFLIMQGFLPETPAR